MPNATDRRTFRRLPSLCAAAFLGAALGCGAFAARPQSAPVPADDEWSVIDSMTPTEPEVAFDSMSVRTVSVLGRKERTAWFRFRLPDDKYDTGAQVYYRRRVDLYAVDCERRTTDVFRSREYAADDRIVALGGRAVSLHTVPGTWAPVPVDPRVRGFMLQSMCTLPVDGA